MLALAAFAFALVLTGCAGNPQAFASGVDGTLGPTPARESLAAVTGVPTFEPPKFWLVVEREVILLGQAPRVDVHPAGFAGRGLRIIAGFSVVSPDNRPVGGLCALGVMPTSAGTESLEFSCAPFDRPGVYTVRFDPSRLSWQGEPVEAKIRVLDSITKPRPPPLGWVAETIAQRLPPWDCYGKADAYQAKVDPLEFKAIAGGERPPLRIPSQLIPRMSAEHARGVKYVFSPGAGWLVLFDHGEFGGGIEWYPEAGGRPRKLRIGDRTQNVNRASAKDGALYVLQGLSHLGSSSGQLGVVWRDHERFMSRVVARYESEPVEWISEEDGSWTVATREAIWRTTASGSTELVARLPDGMWNPRSLARARDGTLYVGGDGGVLRLTPTWSEAPRYRPDLLVPAGDLRSECSKENGSGSR